MRYNRGDIFEGPVSKAHYRLIEYSPSEKGWTWKLLEKPNNYGIVSSKFWKEDDISRAKFLGNGPNPDTDYDESNYDSERDI